MNLTKNEKKVLKLLLDNSRITDSDIASQLKISSQAVGKIRRKLENNIIEGYTINLNYSKIGINMFAMAIARLTRDGLDKGQLEVEQELLRIPHVINVYRIPKVSATHIILYGFSDVQEMDNFFYSPKIRQQLHKFIESQELYTFSNNSLIKKSPLQLFHKAIDDIGTKHLSIQFKEIERFRKKIIE
ncbi:MAG: Lrp/AsnC family transcriptional regulator [Candidatus Woesearchaeota archaeon]